VSTVNVTRPTANDGVATITLNRPDAMNSLNDDLAQDLRAAVEAVSADEAARVCVLRGEGPAFMAGGDIRFFSEVLDKDDAPSNLASLFDNVHDIIRLLRAMPKPVIAAVHGSAAGYGLSLMASCDMAVVSESTKFTLAYRHLGVSPDGGSTWFLPRIIGVRKTMELALLGDRFDSAAALEMGLVNRVVPDDDFDASVADLAAKIAAGPAQALGRTKALIYGSMENGMSDQLDAEQENFLACAGTDEFREGVTAFLAKRRPEFPK